MLSRDPADCDKNEELFTADMEGLRWFIEKGLRSWYVQRRKELENRPLIPTQAFGQSFDPDKLSRPVGYQVYLDRKLECTLVMVLRLQELRSEAGGN